MVSQKVGEDNIKKLVLIIVSLLCAFPIYADSSDDLIKQKIVEQSQTNYSGKCPCPENLMNNGRRCGRRSAYSRPGGASPLCYKSDVTEKMLKEYKMKMGLKLQ